MIYEFKVSLKHVGVPVWRKIQIDGHATFYDLHRVLQVAFEWFDYHLHSFFVNRTNGERVEQMEITSEDTGDDAFVDLLGDRITRQEKDEVVGDWLKEPYDKVMYVYDFGDDWHHEIVFNKKLKPEKGVSYPRCISAKNLPPEEDSREEVLTGGIDLTATDSKRLVQDVNDNIRFYLKDLLTAYEQPSAEKDSWHDVFVKAKEFQKLKPWEIMFDEHIFAVKDPKTNEWLYCSVLGGAGEMFGLAVYVGDKGYRSLVDTLTSKKPDFDFVINQRSLLLSYEDREDLEKSDYQLIKSYDVKFRGRKSWPSLRSYKPGLYPWFMDDDEARLMLLALEQTIDVYHEIKNGLALPDMLFDEHVMMKVPSEQNGELIFDNQVLELGHVEEEEPDEVPLAVSEVDLKRLEKLNNSLPYTVEFSMDYMDMPVQNNQNERPLFPLLVLGVDRTKGMAIYYNLLTEVSDRVVLQTEFVKMIESLQGIPESIKVDERTEHVLAPLIKEVKLNVEVETELPLIRHVMEMMQDDMMPF
ncbi:hypothetical protein GCM10007063_07090 [Lentibacillus kapialis]|uniref:TnpR protein n=1 Tax=Lentibacillus kapialis TaxID=340214 RepID=A0A917PPG1_9BACI|nr:plasmid pRiA4b ORF-3 family protein [Lentibacillus kapialis]GGJ87162.1 hypothetical protein GCM10007063_07090 [Lentibacillus kapialis]